MKEFEKWFKTLNSEGRARKVIPVEVAVAAWRAALEWAIKQNTKGIEEDGTISQCPYIMQRVLKEELES